jgi:hypothetical protein
MKKIYMLALAFMVLFSMTMSVEALEQKTINTGLTRLNFNFDIGRHFCIVYPTLANIRYAEADYL